MDLLNNQNQLEFVNVQELFNPDINKLAELRDEIADKLISFGEKLFISKGYPPFNNDQIRNCLSHADELICDLGAIMLAGPSFFYALVLMSEAPLLRVETQEIFDDDHPPLLIRFEFAKRCLKHFGYQVPINDIYCDENRTLLLIDETIESFYYTHFKEYDEWLDDHFKLFEKFAFELIKSGLNYYHIDREGTEEDWINSLHKVYQDINNGKTIPYSTRPSFILNVIWEKLIQYPESAPLHVFWRKLISNFVENFEGEENYDAAGR